MHASKPRHPSIPPGLAPTPSTHIHIKHGDDEQLGVPYRHRPARLERQTVAIHIHLQQEAGRPWATALAQAITGPAAWLPRLRPL